MTPENGPNIPLEESPSHKIPWAKVVALGCLTPIVILLAWGFIKGLAFAALLYIALIFRGVEHVLILFYLIALPVIYSLLRRWGVRYPFIVAFTSLIFLYALYYLAQKVFIGGGLDALLAGYEPTTWEDHAQLLRASTLIIGGVGIFLLATFLTNRLRNKVVGICLLVLIVTGVCVGSFAYKKPALKLEKLPAVKDVSWRLLPTNVPSWLKESGEGGSRSCSEQDAKAGWYTCEYEFVNYPGYLDAESQAFIAQEKKGIKEYDRHFEPSPFFWVQVIRDDELLKPYKYNNEKCDWGGLSTAGTAPRGSDGRVVAKPKLANRRPPELRRCIMVKTPAGKSLYYESYKNYSEEVLKVPVRFYFEQQGSIVLIGIEYPNLIRSDEPASLYLTDVNFQNELYKFVDSFKR
ncbi:MAG TPA: hypothetical protein VF733_06035 [Candidatus Saccharimonadales bacterium]